MTRIIKKLFRRVVSLGPFFSIGVILMITTIALYSNSGSQVDSAIQKASQEQVSIQTQVTGTTYESPLVDATPTQAQVKQGLLPVKVLNYTDYLNIIKKNKGLVSFATVNPDTRVTSFAVKSGKDSKYVFASYVLPEQRSKLLLAYDDAKATVAITAPASQGANSSNTIVSTGTSVSSGEAVNPLNGLPTSTLPYGYAPASIAAANNYSPGAVGVTLFLTSIIMIALSFRKRNKKEFEIKGLKAGKVGGIDKVNEEIDIPTTRFSDIAGCDEALEDMQELVLFIKEPERFTRLNIPMPKGALLVGPPGTGKTLLARAVAGEAGIPFYSVAGSDFTEVFVGQGAKRVRELFEKARKNDKGAIVFIDEIDAIAKARSANPGHGSNSEQENTLNALLVEMDGFNKSSVIVLGATNRDDVLDPAILRPGRLGRKIQVTLPDRVGREKILEVHSANKPIQENVDFDLIARRTHGMSGADLAQVVTEACMVAAREDRNSVSAHDFDSALATVTMGKARLSAVITPEDRKLTAWHEAGHALCGLMQPDAVSPAAVSIIPRGFAGGVTHFPQRDSGYMKRREAYAQLVTAFGGMAAEQALLGEGEFTTGPSSDLQHATKLALAMVTQFGMGESLVVSYDNGILGNANMATDEAMVEVKAILDRALKEAQGLISEHNKLFQSLVEALLDFETLSQTQIDDLVAGRKLSETTLSTTLHRLGTAIKAGYPKAKTREEMILEKERDDADNAKVKGKKIAKAKARFSKSKRRSRKPARAEEPSNISSEPINE